MRRRRLPAISAEDAFEAICFFENPKDEQEEKYFPLAVVGLRGVMIAEEHRQRQREYVREKRATNQEYAEKQRAYSREYAKKRRAKKKEEKKETGE